MRYTPYFLAVMLLLAAVIVSPAIAGDKDGEDGQPMMLEEVHPDMNPPMAGGPQGEMRACGPWERCRYEMPWNFWRHLDEGILDLDAIHYMGNVRTIAILPFADQTSPTMEGDSRLGASGGPRRIVENLAAILMARGYLVIPPADAEAAVSAYLRAGQAPTSPEIANNRFYFQNMPQRAIDFHLEMVAGLQEQYDYCTSTGSEYLGREDIQAISGALGADAVIRGFIYEFAVTRDIDADWRTLVPPFLGLINPDRRATVEVAYYLYDGPSGELIWNGAVDVRDDAAWPLFESERELLRDVEHQAAWGAAEHILPNWMDLIQAHPQWVPYEMWYEFGDEAWEGESRFPNWINPMREGWHRAYHRHGWRFEMQPVEEPLPTRYRELTDSYYHLRQYEAPSGE
jgi:hypothetical protein